MKTPTNRLLFIVPVPFPRHAESLPGQIAEDILVCEGLRSFFFLLPFLNSLQFFQLKTVCNDLLKGANNSEMQSSALLWLTVYEILTSRRAEYIKDVMQHAVACCFSVLHMRGQNDSWHFQCKIDAKYGRIINRKVSFPSLSFIEIHLLSCIYRIHADCGLSNWKNTFLMCYKKC